MKKQVLLALPLAAVLAFPAVAQNTQPSSSDQQQQSQSQAGQQMAPADQNAQKPAGETATGKEPLVYQQHEGFWGKINPFARKKYVQRQLTPIGDRVNELDQLTAANSKLIKDVDSRATEGIRMASDKATQADNHAVEATNRAQQATQTAQQASQQLTTVQQTVEKVDQYEPATQVEIRFAPGQLVLSKKAKEALADLGNGLKDQRGYIVEVQGFSSGKGQAAIQNSQQMADAVTRYLVLNHDVPVYRIYSLSMGNAPVPASANAANAAEGQKVRRTRGGRVEVSLLKNSLGSMAAATPSSSMPSSSSTSNSNLPASDQTPPASSNVGASGAATSTSGSSSSTSTGSSSSTTPSSTTPPPSSDVSNPPSSTQNPPSSEQKPPAKPPVL